MRRKPYLYPFSVHYCNGGIRMPGIMGIISTKKRLGNFELLNAFHKEPSVKYNKNYSKFPGVVFGRLSLDKFQNDKIFKKTDNYFIATEGIIFNSKKLLQQYSVKKLDELISKLFIQYDWKFVEKLRGNFSGFIYTTDNKLVVFTDHLAAKPIYYFYDEESDTLIFASELKVVSEGLKQLGYTVHLDIKGAHCLLTLGFMLGDLTLIKEIKKLPPGNVLIYENGKISLKEYYRLSNTPYLEDDEEEIIKELDKRFREAVKLEYEKDLEYGYSHIATLSGGLDSRTNVAYAKKLGFNNITCFTFSESDYLDEKIAKRICFDQHFEFIFYSLDNGNYLMNNIENIIESNEGLIFYGGASHLYNCCKMISFQDFGLIHTGQAAEHIKGTILHEKYHRRVTPKILQEIAYSTKLIHNLEYLTDENDFNFITCELFSLYNRGFNGVFNGYRMIEQFTEFSSPFLNVDFLEYAMKVHPKYRYNFQIFFKLINKYIPEFSNYKWEASGIAPKYPLFYIRAYSKSRALFRKLSNRLKERHSSMNPMDYWWKNNMSLQNNIKFIFKENIKLLETHPVLLDDSNYLFEKGTFLEKTQVITLLKAIELLDLENPKSENN